jgi:hypothetical protein
MPDLRIVKSARITAQPRPMPEGMFDPMPDVYLTLEDGTEVHAFQYYPDEISFNPEEFVGLTVDEARRRKFVKDAAFLDPRSRVQ